MENFTSSDGSEQQQRVDQSSSNEESNLGAVALRHHFEDRGFEETARAAAAMPLHRDLVTGRVARKRKMNAIQSRKKRERQKAVIENLRIQCAEYSIRNFDLYQKNHSLDVLLQKARKHVESYYTHQSIATDNAGTSIVPESLMAQESHEPVSPAPIPPTTGSQLSNILLQLLASTRSSSDSVEFGQLGQIDAHDHHLQQRTNESLEEKPSAKQYLQASFPDSNSLQFLDSNSQAQLSSYAAGCNEQNYPQHYPDKEGHSFGTGLPDTNERSNLAILSNLMPLETLINGPVDPDLLFQNLVPALLLQISGVDPTTMLQQKIAQHIAAIVSLLQLQSHTRDVFSQNEVLDLSACTSDGVRSATNTSLDSMDSKVGTGHTGRNASFQVDESLKQLAKNWLTYMLHSSAGKNDVS